MLLSMNRFKDC